MLGKGEHEIISSWIDPEDDFQDEIETTLEITRSNITFVGTGKGSTTILGGTATYVMKHS